MIYGIITLLAVLVLIACSVLFAKFVADERAKRTHGKEARRTNVPSPRLPAAADTRDYIEKYFRK